MVKRPAKATIFFPVNVKTLQERWVAGPPEDVVEHLHVQWFTRRSLPLCNIERELPWAIARHTQGPRTEARRVQTIEEPELRLHPFTRGRRRGHLDADGLRAAETPRNASCEWQRQHKRGMRCEGMWA